jgi:hypothetical protein
MIELVRELADWKAGTLEMAKRAHTQLMFGEKKVCGQIVIAGGMPALGLYRMTNPSTAQPWGIENVECCQVVLIFKTRECLDAVRGWLAEVDGEFDNIQGTLPKEASRERN